MKWHRKLLVLAAIAAIVTALVYGFMEKPVPVDTARVGRGPLRVTVEEDGETRVIDRYTVTGPVTGYMRRITLREGDPVVTGGELARLDPLLPEVLDPRARARAGAGIQAAEAAVEKASEEEKAAAAAAVYAGSELARISELFDRGIVAKDELERAESEDRVSQAGLRSARFAVDVARHELEAARTALKYSAARRSASPVETVIVRSPVEGRVLRVLRKSEGMLSQGEALLEIGDPAAIEVQVDVLSDDAVRISPGTRVVFVRWGGDGPLEGRVRLVEPSGFTKVSALGVEEQRVWVISDITSPRETWSRLGDGYRVDASFVIWEAEDVLQIPESALFRHNGSWSVFVVQDGRASLRQVRTDHKNGVSAEIVSGLKEGEEVITHPGRAVRDGAKVKRREM